MNKTAQIKHDTLIALYTIRATIGTATFMAHSGICYNVRHLLRDIAHCSTALAIMSRKMRHWPHYSGNRTYPITSNPDRDPCTEYNVTDETAFWSKSSPYGRLRRDLLDYLIEVYECECDI